MSILGEPIVSNKLPVTTGSTTDSVFMHTASTNKKPIGNKTPNTAAPIKTTLPVKTTTKLTKQKPKPKPTSSISSSSLYSTFSTTHKPFISSTQKIKHTSAGTSIKHQQNTVKNTLAPIRNTNSHQPATLFTSKPTTFISSPKPITFTVKPSSTINLQKIPPGISTTVRPSTQNAIKMSSSTFSAFSGQTSKRPTQTNKFETNKFETKRPITTQNRFTAPPHKTSIASFSNGNSYASKLPLPIESFMSSTKKNPNSPSVTFITSPPTKKKTSPSSTKQKLKINTPTMAMFQTTQKPTMILSPSTTKYILMEHHPTTKRTMTTPIQPTTLMPPNSFEPEPDNVFDSELSLNQIIESLKDLEGTTMPYAQNVMDFVDMTTMDSNSMPAIDKVNTESVTIYNNGQDHEITTQSHSTSNPNDFKQSMGNRVSYIPQTTMDYPSFLSETHSYRPRNKTNEYSAMALVMKPTKHFGIQHKESDDEMDENILEEKTSTELYDLTTTESSMSKQQTSEIDSMLRESIDNVMIQVQNDRMSTTIDYETDDTTTYSPIESTKQPNYYKKKVIVKPTPYIPIDELGGATEPMTYFETVIKHYEKEKIRNDALNNNNSTTLSSITERTNDDWKTTEKMISIETSTMMSDFETQDTTVEVVSNDNFSNEFLRTEKLGPSTESIDFDESVTTELSTEENSSSYKTENFLDITNAGTTSSLFTDSDELTTNSFTNEPTDRNELKSFTNENGVSFSTRAYDDSIASTTIQEQYDATTATDSFDENTTGFTVQPENKNDSQHDISHTQYEMIKLIDNITKTMINDNNNASNAQNITVNSLERKEDSNEQTNKTTVAQTNDVVKQHDNTFSDLGESPKPVAATSTTVNITNNETKSNEVKSSTKIPNQIKNALNKLKIPTLAPILNNLKMKVVNALKNTNTINLDPAPSKALGLEESTANAGDDILEFTRFCNEVAFNFWTALNNDGISSARSITLSPFALTSVISLLFLGARDRTSTEINDMLHLDDIVSFNPHALLRNISESVSEKQDANIHTSAFIREIFSDRSRGKILSFFKEKVHQFYSGYVEEVNFSTVNDIVRRRTNLLMKRYTSGRVNEYLKTSNVWVKPPLAAISANMFETDCSKASKNERDGEMFFQVLPAIRQRRLVPIPAVVFKSDFTAGYDPELDATAVAIGLSKSVVSTIFVMPGQQGHSAPGDNLERLESVLMVNAVSKNAWRRLLATLMERPGLEVQIPRFTHRSFINATNSLRKLGLSTLFDQNEADLRGIFGAITRDMFVSDLIQINTFSTCGEDKLSEEHHVEMYPAPPNKHRTIEYSSTSTTRKSTTTSASTVIPNYESERAFATDPLYDLKYLNLPLPLRPRQARIPEAPRLRFDKP